MLTLMGNLVSMLESGCHWRLALLTGLVLILFSTPAITAPAQVDDLQQGLRLLNLKRYPEAEKRINRVLTANPSDPQAYHLRGMARLYQNKLQEAARDLRKALQLAPSDADIMAGLGKVYYQSGQTSKAVQVLDQAVKTDPDNLKATNQLAWVLAVSSEKEIRDGTRAVTLAKRLVAKEGNVHALDTLAAAYAASKKYKKAVSVQEKALAVLVNQGRLHEIGPYMARLNKYRQNKPWIDKKKRTPSVLPTAKKTLPPLPETTTEQPRREKPVVKKTAAVKPVGTKSPPPESELTPETRMTPIREKTTTVPKSKIAPQRAAAHKTWPPPQYPYVIQITSFPDRRKAFATASFYRQKGDPTYTAPIVLKESGNWNRVFFGWYTDADRADEMALLLKERHFRHPSVVLKPYTVLIESTRDMNKLERIERRLIKLGQIPYRLPDRHKKGYWRILVGAYSGRTIPAFFQKQLRREGFQPEMVIR